MYATIPTMILIGINAINYAVGAPLSTEVKAGIPALLERIAEIVITATGEETD